jgi:hypothetical protein
MDKTRRTVLSGSRLFNTVFGLPRNAENIARSLGTFQSGPLRAVASWLFFRVARSLRINLDMVVARALKNSQLIRPLPDESHAIYGTGH